MGKGKKIKEATGFSPHHIHHAVKTSEDSTCGHNQEGDNPPRGLEEKACGPSAEEDKMEKSLDDLKVEDYS
ncbi:unnamed protein product [Arctogadus glacialis]